MSSDFDDLGARLATLRSLPVGDVPPVSELRRRIERRRRHRYWAALAVVCAVAVTAAAVGVRGRRGGGGPATGHVNAPPQQPGPRTPRLVTLGGAPAALAIIDAEAGTVRQVPAPALPLDPYPMVALPQHRVVFTGETSPTSFGVFAIDLDHPGSPLLLGGAKGLDGVTFVPSAHPGRVWLVNFFNPRQTVREVTATGAVTVPDTPTPNGGVEGDTARGLVLGVSANGGAQTGTGELLVWDPATRRTVTTIPDDVLVSAAGDLVASCRSPCTTVTITNVRTGKRLVVAAPADTPYLSGVLNRIGPGWFSPDGRLLAVWATARPQDLQGPAAIVVIDTTLGKVTSTHAKVSDPAALAWSADSGRVYVSSGQTGLSWTVGVLTPGRGFTSLTLPPVSLAEAHAFAVDDS